MAAKKRTPAASDFDVLRVFMLFIGGVQLFNAARNWEDASIFQIVMGTYFLAMALGGETLILAVFKAGFAASDFFGALFAKVGWRSNTPPKQTKRRSTDNTPAFVPLASERPIPTLKELAEEAIIVLDADSDFYEEPFVRGPQHTDLDVIRELYGHCRCDWFAVALNVVKGWEIVAAGSPGQRSVHRLVRDPQGRLVDVYGYVTVEELQARYGISDLEIFDELDVESTYEVRDEYIPDFVAAMLYLPTEPFQSMRRELRIWVRYGGASQTLGASAQMLPSR